VPGPIDPLKRTSVVDLAARALRDRILRGDLAEGAALRQDALAAELGVSRIPLREALRRLEAEGLVTITTHHGAVVSVLSLAEVEELFELRALIESELLRRAVPRLTPTALERAGAALDAYDEALSAGLVSAWGRHNWAFHSALLSAAGRPLTLKQASMLHNQSDRYMRMQLALTGGEARARDEHAQILRAAGAGEARQAAALLKRHIRAAGQVLLTFLREHRSLEQVKGTG
jgi:DNA-binding GntR family transcriptional regulator